MIQMIRKLLQKYQELVRYIIVGVLTTVLSTGAYFLLYYLLEKGSLSHYAGRIATIVSWFIAVLFAFFANKLAVFRSRSMAPGVFLREFVLFFGCRFATLVFDYAFIWATVDYLGATPTAAAWPPLYARLHPYLMKLVDDFFVTIFNYVISKFLIFTRNKGVANGND